MIRKTLLPLLLLFIFTQNSISNATNIEGRKYTEQYKSFKNINLPFDANIINTIFQDVHGMIWIGTKKGLFSYNGYNTQSYRNDKKSDGNAINAIVRLDNNLLCIGTDYGILNFNLLTEEYEQPLHNLTSIKAVRSLALFDNKLWIGSRDEGLFYYDLKTTILKKCPPSDNPEERTVIYALEPTKDKLFIGSYDGLSYYDKKSAKRKLLNFPDHKKRMVNSLLWDKKNKIWVGTEGCLYQYDLLSTALEKTTYAAGNSFKTLALNEKNDLLAGTDCGLYIFNTSNGEQDHLMHDSRLPQSLCNNVIWKIFVDRDKNIWLGTDHGISMLSANSLYQAVHISKFSNTGEGNLFTCIYSDKKGRYWFGGENGLLLVKKKDNKSSDVSWFHSNSTNKSLIHNRIRCIYEDRDGEIWIATDGSISRYDDKTEQFIHYTITDKTGTKNAKWAYGIYEDARNKLWIGTYMGGLFIVDKQKLIQNGSTKPFRALNNLTDKIANWAELGNIIYKLIPDGNGTIWLNTQKGLASINEKSLNSRTYDIYMDNMEYNSYHSILYSSAGSIYKYDITSNKVDTLFSSVYNNIVNCFIRENNNVWFSTSNGIYCINSKTFIIKKIVQPPYSCFSGCYDTQNKVLLWGCDDYILYMNPINKKEKQHPVYITNIQCNGKRKVIWNNILNNNVIKIKRSDNITLELSTFNYFMQNGNQFYYKLNDETSWHRLEKAQNQITFANLSSGDYTLYLTDVDPEYQLRHPSIYHIVVPYPWYLSTTALVVYLTLLILSVWILIKRIQYINKRKYERKEKEKSLELSNQKIDFFINISHELKTPLSLIIAPLSKMISETKNSRQRKDLELIHKNSLRLNSLIYRILDLRKLNLEGEDTLIRSHVELCSLIKNSINTFSSTLIEKGIKVTVTFDKNVLWMNLDVLKIESAILNLLSNAIKYSPENNAQIDITLTTSDSEARICISDNGRGINEKELPFVFIRFFQGKNGIKRKDSTGIGLYLVKKYVELHNGNVNVKNKVYSTGAIFEINLPIKGDNAFSYQSEIPVSEDLDTNNKFATLLIIDDNEEMVDFLLKALSENFHCIKAYDGKEGLEVIEERKPDLIVVDEMMPQMSGLEFCRILRHNQPTASIPVIMLTAKDDTETELESIKAGVDVFMSKPFDVKKLMLRITQLLQNRSILRKDVKIESITQSVSQIDEKLKAPDEILLEKITKTIEDNIENEEFNVSMLSESINIEQKQLYRKVKQLLGTTPVNYIRQIRMKKASILLRQNKFTISETMFMVGYTNASYFTRCFIKEYGMTPKQYMIEESSKN